jgi:hypothetical protein
MFVMKQPFFIYTKLPKEKILEKFQVREQYPRDHDIGKLLRQFERVMKSWPVNQLKNVTRFDYTSDPDYKRIDRVVLNYLTGGSI